MLGNEDDRTLTDQVRQVLLSQSIVFDDVISVTSFDYGPEKRLAFIQVEMSMSPHRKVVQKEIENMEYVLKILLNLDATIYWDSRSDDEEELADEIGEAEAGEAASEAGEAVMDENEDEIREAVAGENA